MLVAALVGLSSCHSEGIGAQTRARIREQERAEALAPPAQQVSFEPQVVVGTRPPASADEVVEGTVVRARQARFNAPG